MTLAVYLPLQSLRVSGTVIVVFVRIPLQLRLVLWTCQSSLSVALLLAQKLTAIESFQLIRSHFCILHALQQRMNAGILFPPKVVGDLLILASLRFVIAGNRIAPYRTLKLSVLLPLRAVAALNTPSNSTEFWS